MSTPLRTASTWAAMAATFGLAGTGAYALIKPVNEANQQANSLQDTWAQNRDNRLYGMHVAPKINIENPLVEPVDPKEADPYLWAQSKKGIEFLSRLGIDNPIYTKTENEIREASFTALENGLTEELAQNDRLPLASLKELSKLEEWFMDYHSKIQKYLNSMPGNEDLKTVSLSKPFLHNLINAENSAEAEENSRKLFSRLSKFQTDFIEYQSKK